MTTGIRRSIAAALIVTITHLGCIGALQAAMIGTDASMAAPAEREGSDARVRIANFLDRADVAAQLEKLGIGADEARARVAALSDEDARQAAGRIDALPAGGDGFGALIGAAVLVFLVLLVTDILGLTKVFSFTRSIRAK